VLARARAAFNLERYTDTYELIAAQELMLEVNFQAQPNRAAD